MLQHRQPDLTLVMDNVNKAHNLAAIIRSCDAVGIHQIHAVSYRRSIHTKQNAAAGSSKWIKISLENEIEKVFRDLRSQGLQILVASSKPGSVDFRNVDYTVPTALVVGAEWTGPSDETVKLSDKGIYIPMQGMVESLNVSVAAAVILFEAQRQRLEKGMYGSSRFSPEVYRKLIFEYTYPKLSAICEKKGTPYPLLDENGAIIADSGAQ